MFKRLLLLSALFVLATSVSAQLLNPSGGIAFKVGNTEFTKGYVDSLNQSKLYAMIYQDMVAQGANPRDPAIKNQVVSYANKVPAEQRTKIKYSVIQELVASELMTLEAENLNLKPSKGYLDTLRAEALRPYGGEEGLKASIKAGNTTKKDFEKQIQAFAKSGMLQKQVIGSPVPPTEADKKKYFKENKKIFPINDSIKGIRIQTKSVSKSIPAILNGYAAEIRLASENSLMAAMQFAAKKSAEKSDDPSIRKMGGQFTGSLSTMPKPFASAVKNLKVGDVSKVFKTNEGSQIFLMLAKNDGKFESYAPAITEILKNQLKINVMTKMDTYIVSLMKKYPVVYLDKSYELPKAPQPQVKP